MLLYRLIIRITLISTFYWRSLLIDKTEVYFSLSFMSSNCIQCLVDSTYLQFDVSCCSTVTYRLFLNHLNLSRRKIHTDIVNGIVCTISIATVIINLQSEI